MASRRDVAVVALLLGVLGCSSQRASLAAEMPPTSELFIPPNGSTQPVQRAQKQDDKVVPVRSLELINNEFSGPPGGQVTARILANVNGIPILYEEVLQTCYPFLRESDQLPEPERSVRRKEVITAELQRIVEREVILQDAFSKLGKREEALKKFKDAATKEFEKQMRQIKQRNNFTSDDQLKSALKSQGISMEGMKRQIERSFMAMEYMRSRIYRLVDQIGHPQILDYYQDHQTDFQTVDTVKWLDIFIDAGRYPTREAALALAKQLVTRVKAGEDFVALGKQYDNGDSSYRDGLGFGGHHGEIKPPEAEAILFQMHDGDVGPIIELANGYHVIKLVHRDTAGTLPFDERVQIEIKKRLQNEIADREYKRVLMELKRKAVIEFAKN